jgi:DNA-binding response OmpR family regulator
MAKHFPEVSVIQDKPSSFTNQPCILLAEDDDELRKLLAWSLHKEGYKVTECTDGMDLLNHLDGYLFSGETIDVDLIISDIRMPGLTGLEILEGLHTIENFPPMILITAFGDEETHAQAQRLGAAAILDKPFDIEDLLTRVREILCLSTSIGSRRFLVLKKERTPIKFPLDIVFRHISKSEQLEAFVCMQAAKLNRFSHNIVGCRVVIDMPHHHHERGNLYHVRITLTVFDQDLIVGHDPGESSSHKNLLVAISDAFDATRHQIKVYLDKHRSHRN